MADNILIDEFHVELRVPRDLTEADGNVIRRTLLEQRFQTDFHRTLRRLLRRYPALQPVRVQIAQ